MVRINVPSCWSTIVLSLITNFRITRCLRKKCYILTFVASLVLSYSLCWTCESYFKPSAVIELFHKFHINNIILPDALKTVIPQRYTSSLLNYYQTIRVIPNTFDFRMKSSIRNTINLTNLTRVWHVIQCLAFLLFRLEPWFSTS